MPILYDGPVADLTGHCAPEEADELLAWLGRTAAPRVRLADCATLHTALLQVLLALKPEIRGLPGDEALRRWLAPLTANPVSLSVEGV